ncbi:HdeD family acid-resistance protein [Actinomadura rugatobispora]|uniref:HdeD family acid-resistance protein n=1 Tax=Actinomadura rugatobispora TaxID=1994 RepID=A0ABW0ZUP7_9ACTN|nr:HdeD family acid-resistance protein [Actinomadura rugatobispora]
MFDLITRHWWVLAVRGGFAVLFGLAALFWPGITVLALVILFGLYALVDGIIALVGAIRGGFGGSRTWAAVIGVAGIVLGLVALIWPAITAFALLMLIAVWAVVVGVFEIISAVALRREIEGEWFYIAAGALSVLFGVLLFAWPVSGALALVWLIGAFAIVVGAIMIGAAFRLRKAGKEAERRAERPAGGMGAGGATPTPG